MKTNIVRLTIILLTLSGWIQAQNQNFNLSNYKLPVLHRKTLESNFGLYSSDSYQLVTPYTTGTEYKSNSFSGDFSFYYKGYNNTPRLQSSTYAGISGYGSYQNYKTENKNTTEYYSYNPSLSYNTTNLWYINSKLFFETDGYISSNYSSYTNRNFSYPDPTISQNINVYAMVPLKIGIGRIEDVSDARHAIYILDELGKQNRIKQGQSEEEVLEFAAFISQLKNKRFFDSREQKMAEMESIDSFLRVKGYIKEADVRYFNTLRDFWDYGDQQTRKAGTRISAAVEPGYYIYNNKYTNPATSESTINASYINAGLEATRENPVSLSWQQTTTLKAFYGLLNGKEKHRGSDDYTIKVPEILIEASHNYGFFPNTRTSFYFGANASFGRFFDKTDLANKVEGIDAKAIKGSLNTSANYYISPKVRFNITCNLNYTWQDSKDNSVISFNNFMNSYIYGNISNLGGSYYNFPNRNLNFYLSASLSYSIF